MFCWIKICFKQYCFFLKLQNWRFWRGRLRYTKEGTMFFSDGWDKLRKICKIWRKKLEGWPIWLKCTKIWLLLFDMCIFVFHYIFFLFAGFFSLNLITRIFTLELNALFTSLYTCGIFIIRSIELFANPFFIPDIIFFVYEIFHNKCERITDTMS